MAEMTALKPFAFKGRMLKVGERFTITEPAAKLLTAIKRAAYFEETSNVQHNRTETERSVQRTESKASGKAEDTKNQTTGKTDKSENKTDDEVQQPAWLSQKQASRKKSGK